MAGSSGGELVGVHLIPCSLAVWVQFRAASWRARRAGGTEGCIDRCSNVQAQGGSTTRASLDAASGRQKRAHVRVAFVNEDARKRKPAWAMSFKGMLPVRAVPEKYRKVYKQLTRRLLQSS